MFFFKNSLEVKQPSSVVIFVFFFFGEDPRISCHGRWMRDNERNDGDDDVDGDNIFGDDDNDDGDDDDDEDDDDDDDDAEGHDDFDCGWSPE